MTNPYAAIQNFLNINRPAHLGILLVFGLVKQTVF